MVAKTKMTLLGLVCAPGVGVKSGGGFDTYSCVFLLFFGGNRDSKKNGVPTRGEVSNRGALLTPTGLFSGDPQSVKCEAGASSGLVQGPVSLN